MRLDAFEAAVLADARADAERVVAEASQEARRRLGRAREQADEECARARRLGREDVERETRRRRADVRRHAREQVLRARREAVDRLRAEMLCRLRADDVAHDALGDQLVALARTQLGDGVEIDQQPDGGLIAHRQQRWVDYRLEAIVARALEDMQDEVAQLWS